ncbi:MAG: cyclic nucleotide-binding protein [Rhodospirillales bacterium SCN 65-16]|jgi:CRP/FNR family cyclic AMP-dependent transcriptional regulator|uniref:cyclic nucleotide-binding domain-containing protein n=1 Tax=Reyranella massiliensis TaxID=445220 RepID=UPI0002FC3435|nr:Crp/Fnr family transcriptional regulator [Reyranella massiliensis]MCA0247442.1 Crp/Fnr family transcriptional regulator [Pseudomonadota bacterium]ODT99731.1 MAG: cyclic nucleotide-binding protein [Rhodospirillales bacterium SCN 65-16]
MNLNEEVELLKGVPIFSKVEQAKLKLLAFTSERVNFAAGQEVCHQGDPGDTMYVILGGVADVLIDTDKGQIVVAEMQPNSFFGEIAILCDVPRTATIKAREPLSTLKITKDMFYRLVAEFPQMAVEIMRELAHRLEDTNEKLRAATRAAA